MGTYLEFTAKPGCEDQLNAAYAAHTGRADDFLVYSDKVIAAEIAFIHSPSGQGQAHLRRHLHTVEDWSRIFPMLRAGRGQRKLSGIGEDERERIANLRRDIRFILDHRMLFQSITGLDDARQHGFTEFGHDLIEEGRGKARTDDPALSFADLPKGRSDLYRCCVAHGRPDLWAAWRVFQNRSDEASWLGLRDKVIPWTDQTVWQSVEESAAERDGKHFGLRGRFRDGVVPDLVLVYAALRARVPKDPAEDAPGPRCG